MSPPLPARRPRGPALRRAALAAIAAACLAPLATAETSRGLTPAFANRIAIVVGNQDYEGVPDLANARRDAKDMAELLRGFGFVVYDRYDVDRRDFENLMRTAMLNVPDAADVVFYYAGHGIQIGRRNYLLPVDVSFDDIYDLPVETMTLDRVIDALSSRGAAHVAIIDACRENPFPGTELAGDLSAELYETKAGFDVFRTPLNSLVAFSTSPGEVALDGADGENSPYTGAILSQASATPSENIVSLFSEVREAVYRATEGRQIPWESSTLVRPFRLVDDAPEIRVQATPDTGAGEGGARAAARDLPDAVTLSATYQPEVALSQALSDRLGVPVSGARVAAQPDQGSIVTDDAGALYYQPRMEERRATEIDTFETSAEMTFEIPAGGDEPQEVAVTLDLKADPCDIEAGEPIDLDGTGLYRLANEIDADAALQACIRAVEEFPRLARFRHQLGRAQQADGQLEQAMASFEQAMEMGHTRSLYSAGRLLSAPQIDRDVVDIPLDEDRARKLFERGIQRGDPFAMNTLGIDLLRNGATDAERQRGFELLERAVELGHTYSMNELGIYFLSPDTDHYMPDRGMTFLQASFDRDDIYGFANMGYVALNGLDGGKPDYGRAFEMFKRATEGGHPTAPTMLGRMILRGQGPTEDPAEAVRWYDVGLARGDPWGGTNAAIVIGSGDVPGFDAADAALRAAKAMHLPDDEAASQAGEILDLLPPEALGRALQMALNEVGAGIAVDGAVGPGTLGALEEVRRRYDLAPTGDTPRERLLLATKAYWAENPPRIGLF